MVQDSSPIEVTCPSEFTPASSKEFLDIQATIKCRFSLKCVRDMTRIYGLDLLYSVKTNARDHIGGWIIYIFI